MIRTIGMLEFNSIAKGIETCDVMLKAADVELIRTSTVCPGKYIVIIYGDTGSVKASMIAGEANAGPHVVDKMQIQNVHPQLVPALSGTAQVIKGDAIGAMEFYSIASAIKAADVAAKAAQICLINVTIGFAVGGKGIVTLTGDVGAVRAAVASATEEAGQSGYLVGSTVIPKYAPQLYASLL